MLRLSNALPRRAGDCRRPRPPAPVASARVPGASPPSSRVEAPAVVASLGSVVTAGAGPALGGETEREMEELEEGEISASGELRGSLANDSLPRRGTGPGCLPPSVGASGAREENRESLLQTSCLTVGLTGSETNKEDADPVLEEQAEDGSAESANCNGQEVFVKEKKGQADGTDGTTLEKISELGAELAAAPAADHIDRSKVLGSTPPVASTLCRGQEVFGKEKKGHAVEGLKKEECKQYAESKQEKLPTLMENMCSPETDEDSTLRAMKRASWRNLDGNLSGMKQAGQQPVSTPTPPSGKVQSGYLYGDTVAFKLDYPPARGGAAVGCCGVAALVRTATDFFSRVHGWRSSLRIDCR